VRELRISETLWPSSETILSHIQHNLLRAEASPAEPPRCFNVHVILSPDEAARGGIATVAIPAFSFCAPCGGVGYENGLACAACDGQGVLEDEETVRLRIPAMVEDFRCFELPAQGLGLHNCYLRVYIRVAG
jgi:hypothetical protein